MCSSKVRPNIASHAGNCTETKSPASKLIKLAGKLLWNSDKYQLGDYGWFPLGEVLNGVPSLKPFQQKQDEQESHLPPLQNQKVSTNLQESLLFFHFLRVGVRMHKEPILDIRIKILSHGSFKNLSKPLVKLLQP